MPPPSWARAFPGTPDQVRHARQFTGALLHGSPLHDDALLVVSELFTNALRHTRSGSPGGLIVIQITRWLCGVRIAVTDQGSRQRPVISRPGPADGLAENGTGLYLVCQLAKLGWHDDAAGRTVHATLTSPRLRDSCEPDRLSHPPLALAGPV